jgi:hypothetical protein
VQRARGECVRMMLAWVLVWVLRVGVEVVIGGKDMERCGAVGLR